MRAVPFAPAVVVLNHPVDNGRAPDIRADGPVLGSIISRNDAFFPNRITKRRLQSRQTLGRDSTVCDMARALLIPSAS